MTDGRKSRYTETRIIGFLKQAQAGMPIEELCRQEGFSEPTLYKWRAKFGGMDAGGARRLKKLLADAHLDIATL